MTVVIRLLRTPLRRRTIDTQILSRRLLHFGELFLDPLDAPAGLRFPQRGRGRRVEGGDVAAQRLRGAREFPAGELIEQPGVRFVRKLVVAVHATRAEVE